MRDMNGCYNFTISRHQFPMLTRKVGSRNSNENYYDNEPPPLRNSSQFILRRNVIPSEKRRERQYEIEHLKTSLSV